MNVKIFASVLASLYLSGCMPDTPLPGYWNTSRFNIDSYKAIDTSSTNLSGVWIAIHQGELNKTLDGVNYKVTGNIREIVEISQKNGTYYARTCSQPEKVQAVTISGDTVSMSMNDDVAQLTKSSFSVMSGKASHSDSASSYSGTLNMKKVAAPNASFGTFTYYSSAHTIDTLNASCFQDGALHIVGSKSVFSQWTDADILNVSDWSVANKYKQTGYMYSRTGTADAVKQMRFREGSVGADAVVREYPANSEEVSVAAPNVNVNRFLSSYFVNSIMSGKADLSFSIAETAAVQTYRGTTDSTTDSTTTTPPAATTPPTTTTKLWSWRQIASSWHW